jgi:hypothetical protein
MLNINNLYNLCCSYLQAVVFQFTGCTLIDAVLFGTGNFRNVPQNLNLRQHNCVQLRSRFFDLYFVCVSLDQGLDNRCSQFWVRWSVRSFYRTASVSVGLWQFFNVHKRLVSRILSPSLYARHYRKHVGICWVVSVNTLNRHMQHAAVEIAVFG